jgi:serine phosphatase RsbU (regulator of sigma subunit)
VINPERPSLDDFRSDYQAALQKHLETGGETGLAAAYELGRRALAEGLGLLDIAGVHLAAAATMVQPFRPTMAEAADQFFLQSLATFEMAQRGFWDAQKRASAEQHLVTQLQRLAAASVDIVASVSLAERALTVAQQARLVAGADEAAVSCTMDDEAIEAATAEPPLAIQPLAAKVASSGQPLATVETGRQWPLAWMGAPLRVRGGTINGLVQVWRTGEAFTASDQAVLGQLGQIAAVTLENARLFEQEHRIALTLQRSLLPEDLPTIDRIELASRYVPAGQTVHVGGDWYDVLELPGGEVALALGDVMGHGVRAASVMGQLRLALRAYALDGYSATNVVERVDRLLHHLDQNHLASLAYAVLDRTSGQLAIVNAGHPPPLLIDPDGQPRLLTEGLSVMLGVNDPTVQHREELTAIESGSLLLLYSDGLIEDVNQSIQQGMAGLQAALAGYRGGPEGLCDLVLSTIGDGPRRDDVCLLAVAIN